MGEPVSSSTSRFWATICIQLPALLTVLAAVHSRMLRCRRLRQGLCLPRRARLPEAGRPIDVLTDWGRRGRTRITIGETTRNFVRTGTTEDITGHFSTAFRRGMSGVTAHAVFNHPQQQLR
ncbi:hypothetical protein GCM10009606_11780 [Nocardioides aquiterrae]|uniref:Secreted protein n=1 Tax=Nocardioides aquiterrae TaxID=203799 RepID=A0ABP4EU76_9ACTN